MKTDEGNKIYAVVRCHIGRENAISAPDICRAIGWPMSRERFVRQIIADENHLWQGILVCAVGGAGYFVAETFDEARKYRNWLRDLNEASRLKLTRFESSCKVMGIFFYDGKHQRKAAA